MKSIKPGRGPSKMRMVSGIAAALFGIFWCILVGATGAWFMIPFGLIGVGMAIYNAIYNYRNMTNEDRYSIIDIVDEEEEIDPLNIKYGKKTSANQPVNDVKVTSVAYCPYCGTSVNSEFDFCPRCGKHLPD